MFPYNLLVALGNDSPRAIERKHMILSKVPRARAYRILKHMNDSIALRALGTDHANSILSGVGGAISRKNSKGTVIGMQYRSFVKNNQLII